jgi:hypothetical protein
LADLATLTCDPTAAPGGRLFMQASYKIVLQQPVAGQLQQVQTIRQQP